MAAVASLARYAVDAVSSHTQVLRSAATEDWLPVNRLPVVLPKINRRSALAGAGLLLAAPAIVRAQGANGIALVIGNSKYQWEAQLGNVKRDAPDIAKAFQAKGLKTELLQDVNRDTFVQAISKFKAAASTANLAAFYYAGHGASWDKDTYLVPVDADLSTPDTVRTLLPAADVLGAMKAARNRLLVFDNCRNNPADGWRRLASQRDAVSFSASFGASEKAQTEPNSIIIYSTAPGRVALDGPSGQNSPFAASLLSHLSVSSVDMATLATKLRRSLLIATEGQQVVWDSNTYSTNFLLQGSNASNVTGGSSGSQGDASRIVELPNAYAFARKNGLPLPEGLIAYRTTGNSENTQKIGSYEFMIQTPRGPSPFLVILLTIDEQRVAQLIAVTQNDEGRFWRFITGELRDNRLTFQPNYGRPHFMLDWKNTNSGSVGQMLLETRGGGAPPIRSARFERLDG